MFKRFVLCAALVALISVGSRSADASLIMVLNDLSTAGADVVIIDDSLAGTVSSTTAWTSNTTDVIGAGVPDFMLFSGTVGGFTVIATTGTSETNGIGLDSVSVSSTSGGAIDILLIDTDFIDNGFAFLTSFNILAGGVGTVIGQSGYDDGNSEGSYAGDGSGFSLLWPGAIIETEFMTSTSANNPFMGWSPDGVSGSYSMFLAARITHTGAGTTQWSSLLRQIPEPGSLAVWALIGGIGLVAGRRRSRS
jgi:hypothetical protein